MQVRTVNTRSNCRTSNSQCSLFSKKNSIILIRITAGPAVPIHPEKWISTVLPIRPIPLFRIVGFLADIEIRIRGLPSRNLKHYCLKQLSWGVGNFKAYFVMKFSNCGSVHSSTQRFKNYAFIYLLQHVSAVSIGHRPLYRVGGG